MQFRTCPVRLLLEQRTAVCLLFTYSRPACRYLHRNRGALEQSASPHQPHTFLEPHPVFDLGFLQPYYLGQQQERSHYVSVVHSDFA